MYFLDLHSGNIGTYLLRRFLGVCSAKSDMMKTSELWFTPQNSKSMHRYRKPNVEDLAAARQARIRQQNLPPTEQIKEKLADLQKFILQLAHTPHGLADLQQRVRMFGECKQVPGESDRDFYGKLRRWLERDCEELRGTVSCSPLA
jgi:hypothetical protein